MSAPEKIWVNTDDSEDGCCPVETDLDDVGKYFNASSATCYTRTDLTPPDADYVAGLRDALERLHHAVCGETGFAKCVRDVSGIAYPWPALDAADAAAVAALAARPASPDTRVVDWQQLEAVAHALSVADAKCDPEVIHKLEAQARAIIGGQDRG